MSNFNVIGTRLRQAREAREISLENLAAETRINIKFLKEIDAGIQPHVPDTYARAFIRAYAEHVGLDPAELVKELDRPGSTGSAGPGPAVAPGQAPAPSPESTGRPLSAPAQNPSPVTVRPSSSAAPPRVPKEKPRAPIEFHYQSAPPVHETKPAGPARVFSEEASGGLAPGTRPVDDDSPAEMEPSHSPAGSGVRIMMIGLLILTIGAIGAYLWIHHERSTRPARTAAGEEIPQREIALARPQPESSAGGSEQAGHPGLSAAPASPQKGAVEIPKTRAATARPQPEAAPLSSDSLRLEAAVSESVWVQIVIDGRGPHEYLLRPGTHIHWDARKGFTVTVGNPAGIAFTLNGDSLSQLGDNRKPVKNVDISLETLPKLSKGNTDKRRG